MRRNLQAAKVVRVDVESPLEPIDLDARYGELVLVVRSRGTTIGQVVVPSLAVVGTDVQRAAIWRQLGDVLWRQELEQRLRESVGADPPAASQLSVSVIVCTRDRPDELERCLASLVALDAPAHEIIVVDNSPATDAAREACERFAVRYVLEPLPGQSRARNRGIACATGDVIAFTDDDCVTDPAWLARLGVELADQRVMAVTGIVCPLELETAAQYLFEQHGGFRRGFRRRVLDGLLVDGATTAGLAGAGANMAFRRCVFDEVGGFAEWLGPGTPARSADDNDLFCRVLDAGYKIVYDPAQLVWHRHRSDLESLRRVLYDYGVSSTAFAIGRLLLDRDLAATRILGWWWLRHLPREVGRLVFRRQKRMPFRCVLAEARGVLAGPWRLWRSRRSRRSIAPVVLPAAPTPAEDRLVVLGADLPSLSVVIPSADRQRLLERVLDGLAGQHYPVERFETIVVLDGSTDGSAELLRSFDAPYRLRMLEQRKGGVAAARNAGARAAEEAVVYFLDDDIVPEPDCLAAHAAAHQRAAADHVALGYCPPVVDGGWWGQVLRGWWEEHYRRKGEPGHHWTNVDFTTGNSSLPRSLLVSAGGFDEAFRVRHEDWELGARLLRLGASFAYYPAALARHHLDATLAAAVETQRQEARDDIQLVRRHPELGMQLPLAAYRRGRPKVDPVRLSAGVARAQRLERQGRRAAWRRTTSRVLENAYVAGLRDELPSEEAFQALLAQVYTQRPATVELRLDGGHTRTVSAAGPVELALRVGDRVVARVAAARPGAAWDWTSAIERVQHDASRAAQAAVLGDRLAREGERARATLELVDAR